jgi:hypothetical protein
MAKSRRRKTVNRKEKSEPNSTSLSPSSDYVGATVDLYQEVSEPSYEGVMDWMRSSGGRSVIFDFWARGNYTRRLIFQRNKGIQPLLVKVSYVDEMRWAYRRLALLGLPVEFIYSGDIPETSKVVHVDRLPRDMIAVTTRRLPVFNHGVTEVTCVVCNIAHVNQSCLQMALPERSLNRVTSRATTASARKVSWVMRELGWAIRFDSALY